jgi:hypothetical protein
LSTLTNPRSLLQLEPALEQRVGLPRERRLAGGVGREVLGFERQDA